VLFEQKAVARETMMLAFELKSHLVDKLKDSAAYGKIRHCWKQPNFAVRNSAA